MMKRKTNLVIALVGLAVALACSAQANIVVNGDMGAPYNAVGEGSVPAGWDAYGNATSNFTRGQSNTNSPFTSVLADNSSSFYMNDQGTNGFNEGMIQAFPNPLMSGAFSFDFMTNTLPAGASGGQWGVQVADSNWQLTMFRFNINDVGGYLKWYSSGTNNGNILQIQSGTWYHVDSVFNVASRAIGGTVTPFGGSSVAFSGIMSTPTTQPDDVRGIMIRDRTAGASGDLYLDNMNVVVPEPSSVLALASGVIGLAGFAVRRRRA